MDIGATQIATQIASGTSEYFVVYSPIFLLVGGIILAFGIMGFLVSIFTGKKVDVFQDDDV